VTALWKVSLYSSLLLWTASVANYFFQISYEMENCCCVLHMKQIYEWQNCFIVIAFTFVCGLFVCFVVCNLLVDKVTEAARANRTRYRLLWDMTIAGLPQCPVWSRLVTAPTDPFTSPLGPFLLNGRSADPETPKMVEPYFRLRIWWQILNREAQVPICIS